MLKILLAIKDHIAFICMIYGLLATLIVLFSWVYGYWSNGLYSTKFQIESCWTGISSCGVGLVGVFKWLIDSTKNSPPNEFPTPNIKKESDISDESH